MRARFDRAIDTVLLSGPRVHRIGQHGESAEDALTRPPQLERAHEGDVLDGAVLEGGFRCCSRTPAPGQSDKIAREKQDKDGV